MTKILLVEDDQALREIYGTRLIAEGYDVVSASDGEMALTMSIKEQPDLILSDIMMPKVSGFEMVDILKTNPGTRDIKIVVMTALSSDKQREKGESLGVDRYLVKSQVSIEDVVDTIHELMNDKRSASVQTPIAQTPAAQAPSAQPIVEQQPQAPVSPHVAAPRPIIPIDRKIISPLDPDLVLRDEPTPVNNILAPPTSPVTDIDLDPTPTSTQNSTAVQQIPPDPQPPIEQTVQIEDDPLQYKPQ